jgi:hypothetical protein
VVSVMLIHVLYIKLTCDMKPLNSATKKSGTHVIVVLKVSNHFRLADFDVTFLSALSQLLVRGEITSHSRTCTDKACQLIPIVHRPARIPHFSLAIISVNLDFGHRCFGLYRYTLP